MILINAIHFKAEWNAPFSPDKTALEPFMASDREVKVDMMNGLVKARVARLDQIFATAVELPYKDKQVFYSNKLILS